jgi:hypothetical protein
MKNKEKFGVSDVEIVCVDRARRQPDFPFHCSVLYTAELCVNKRHLLASRMKSRFANAAKAVTLHRYISHTISTDSLLHCPNLSSCNRNSDSC